MADLDDPSPLTVFILNEPGMLDRLLAQHVNDGTGHCRVCVVGNQQAHYVWPCTLYAAADAAQRYADHRP